MAKYAYVKYIKPIHSGDVTADGKIVLLDHSCLAGQIDLVTVAELKRLKKQFPDCVTGKEIKDGNLIHMVNYCFDSLKKDAKKLAEKNDRIAKKLEYFKSEFERNGILYAKGQRDIEDLANKYFNFQYDVRLAQSRESKSKKTASK